MANIDRIANVQISLNTTAIKEQNFSDVLVLAAHTLGVNRIMIVTGGSDLLDMGVSEADPLYIAVRDAFKQTPGASQVYIGRRQVDSADVTVSRASQSTYTVTLSWRAADQSVQSVDATFNAGAADTTATIATGLVTAITGTAAPVDAVAVGADITLTARVDGTPFGMSVKGNLTVGQVESTETPSVALAACREESDDWYGLALASRDTADVLDAAEWAESNNKLFCASSFQAGIVDAAVNNDLATQCQQKQYFRTHVWYHGSAAAEALDMAIQSNRFTFYPGQETWANVRLAGITYDNLREDQAKAAFAKNANTFEQFRNFAITQGGKVAAGEWIDVIRFRDWLAEQIKINVVSQIINAGGKVPFTDDGIQIIANGVRAALLLGQKRNGIAPTEQDDAGNAIPGFLIQVPRSVNISANDKANRILRDLKFSARLAGAIHVAELQGSLTYQFQ
ncbi:hypothetical protein [Achromobacter aloeverae]